MRTGPESVRPLYWIGSSRRDLTALPVRVRRAMGFALRVAQCGRKHPDAKPLRGFKGARVLEVVMDNNGDTFRGVYTVRFTSAVYVLHAFQKKSRHGIATDRSDLQVIAQRLKQAEEHHATITRPSR